jgi:hypothetical protein
LDEKNKTKYIIPKIDEIGRTGLTKVSFSEILNVPYISNHTSKYQFQRKLKVDIIPGEN